MESQMHFPKSFTLTPSPTFLKIGRKGLLRNMTKIHRLMKSLKETYPMKTIKLEITSYIIREE